MESAVFGLRSLSGIHAATVPPGRSQREGGSGVNHLRRTFLCSLLGKESCGLEDLIAQMKSWVGTVANERLQGTTSRLRPGKRSALDCNLSPIGRHTPYAEEEPRRVTRDAYVSWQGGRIKPTPRDGPISATDSSLHKPTARLYRLRRDSR